MLHEVCPRSHEHPFFALGDDDHIVRDEPVAATELEQLASRHPGVEKVYAMQAGREIRVIVAPEAVDPHAPNQPSMDIYALGLVLQADYRFGDKVTVGLRYTSIKYEAKAPFAGSFSGDGVGVTFALAF